MRITYIGIINVYFNRFAPFLINRSLAFLYDLKSPHSYRRLYYSSSNSSLSINMFENIIKNPCASVFLVPTLSDNYAYLLAENGGTESLCVDPAQPERVIKVANEKGLNLTTVLCTHKHSDHSGGNDEIRKLIPNITVIGSSYEHVPGVTKSIKNDDIIKFGNLEIKCIKASCHTMGHIMYYVYSSTNPTLQPILFTGDTLFVAGCGRFFEGSAKMMLDIMNNLKKLPPNTLVYCGHEYTVKNLEFAHTVDPSEDVENKLKWAKLLRANRTPTIPSTIGDEMKHNPFMRTNILKDTLGETSEESAMAKLRRMKDVF